MSKNVILALIMVMTYQILVNFYYCHLLNPYLVVVGNIPIVFRVTWYKKSNSEPHVLYHLCHILLLFLYICLETT